ncbi:acyl-CoA-binding protein [Planctobacterium marinum]|uniref:Acyl-CoA-binding protein n=1 Tax=Planctobacterium marinum TaxID=1631968 RepID=A0AA48HJ50_9ALTE|nr:acyl-CoA-binding protein [Planctobacterium marinum]
MNQQKANTFMSLQEAFEQASTESKQLPQRPSDEDMLKIYALFKQATAGDVTGDRPGIFDFVAGAKYDAWAEQKGKSSDDAKQEYVDLINKLKG